MKLVACVVLLSLLPASQYSLQVPAGNHLVKVEDLYQHHTIVGGHLVDGHIEGGWLSARPYTFTESHNVEGPIIFNWYPEGYPALVRLSLDGVIINQWGSMPQDIFLGGFESGTTEQWSWATTIGG